ncbi:MAG: peptide chain release factor N(5)-glutamine methyltransferase [Deltaproteobacteria bacterium]|nr:MAG: peptide chain release factor N(5)-glutamine methyltransferase [Deltaproteobacteria bacterium]
MSRTVLELLRLTTRWLGERGCPSPRVDAEVLLAHVLALPRMGLYTAHDRPLDDAEVDRYRALVRQRAEGVPVAYLTGTRGFWTLDLAVDERVLIPRPETEQLVEEALRRVGERRAAAWRIVDVGTGSGALALALAAELPHARVLGIDLDEDALAVARANAHLVPDPDRIRFVRGDLLAPLREHPRRPHLIVSNPPYIAAGDPRVEADVHGHEPHGALYGGDDGLDIIRRLVPQAAAMLAPGGWFLMEMGTGQGDAVRSLAAPHFAEVGVLRDLEGHDRVLWGEAAGALELGEEPSSEAAVDAGDAGADRGAGSTEEARAGSGAAAAGVEPEDGDDPPEEGGDPTASTGPAPAVDAAGRPLPVVDLQSL